MSLPSSPSRICSLTVLTTALLIGFSTLTGTSAVAGSPGPFDNLLGRWTGEGRLGFAEGKTETITCRGTYFASEDGQNLTQNLRCASAGAKVEVKSEIAHNAGSLAGTWNELIYNKAGQLDGKITKTGYKVSVKGEDLSATMEILVRGDKQIIEIQFNNATLIGLSMVMNKG
jgi:hypothetical protein